MNCDLAGWKGRLYAVEKEIRRLSEDIARAKASAAGTVGHISFEGRSSVRRDKVADGAVEIMALQAQKRAWERERARIDSEINGLGDLYARIALRKYASGICPWWKIAADMHYSESGIKKRCRKALREAHRRKKC